jgi:predicted transposase YbfD/YdcC
VSLVQHGSAVTLAQAAVERKRSEITAVPTLLRTRGLTDTITTMDALLTQRALAQLIDERNGFYLMIVKANQPQLRDDLALFFELRAIAAAHEQWDREETHNKGHGRLEHRVLECTTGDCDTWAGRERRTFYDAPAREP